LWLLARLNVWAWAMHTFDGLAQSPAREAPRWAARRVAPRPRAGDDDRYLGTRFIDVFYDWDVMRLNVLGGDAVWGDMAWPGGHGV
jgi:hypothetical protein